MDQVPVSGIIHPALLWDSSFDLHRRLSKLPAEAVWRCGLHALSIELSLSKSRLTGSARRGGNRKTTGINTTSH